MAKRLSKKAANEAAIAAAEAEKSSSTNGQPFDADDLFDPDEGREEAGGDTATAVAEIDPDGEEDDEDELDDEADELTDEASGVDDPSEVLAAADDGNADPVPPPTEHDLLERIGHAEQACSRAESVMNGCKTDLKVAKGRYESAVNELRSLCRALENDKNRPLLAKMEWKPDSQPVAAVPTEDEAWKDFEVCNLDIPDGVVKSLHEAEITTMRDLAAYTAEEPLTSIKGIGPGKATKIEEATVKFWEKWNAEHPPAIQPHPMGEGEEGT